MRILISFLFFAFLFSCSDTEHKEKPAESVVIENTFDSSSSNKIFPITAKERPVLTNTEKIASLLSKKYITRAEQKFIINTLSKFSALPEKVNAPKNNLQSPDKIKLGKLLFFDPILSGNKDVSCATCHHPSTGYAEFRDLSIGVNGVGLGSKRQFHEPNDIPFTKRNSPTIINTAFNGIKANDTKTPKKSPMFWDVRVNSLEEQALKPIQSFEEMRGHNFSARQILNEVVSRIDSIPEYKQLFLKAFQDSSITQEKIAFAIASFERTLITNNSRFDQYMRGDRQAISSNEIEGFKLFVSSGCGVCHNGPLFSDFKVHNLGVKDNNKLNFSDKGFKDTYAFRTPSLRNLSYTSPFLHNGTKKTLKEVLEFYENITSHIVENKYVTEDQLAPLLKTVNIPAKNMSPIISFLNTLNDDNFDKSIPSSVPSGLTVGGNIH